MLTVHFARHGQTDYSRENRFCGTTDAPLNAVGQRMAEALASRYGLGGGGRDLSGVAGAPLDPDLKNRVE